MDWYVMLIRHPVRLWRYTYEAVPALLRMIAQGEADDQVGAQIDLIRRRHGLRVDTT